MGIYAGPPGRLLSQEEREARELQNIGRWAREKENRASLKELRKTAVFRVFVAGLLDKLASLGLPSGEPFAVSARAWELQVPQEPAAEENDAQDPVQAAMEAVWKEVESQRALDDRRPKPVPVPREKPLQDRWD